MVTECPYCRNSLRVARRRRGLRLLCPFCQRVFQLRETHPAVRQLWAALDVSSSAEPYFAHMLEVFTQLVGRHADHWFTDIGVFLFHRQVLPFPCERLGGLQSPGTMVLPTVGDLRGRVGRGSAILDALHHMLQDAEQPGGSRELVILTDGGDRGSRRHPEEVRYRIEQAVHRTTIFMHIFTKGFVAGPQLNLVRKLSLPQILWSIHAERPWADAHCGPIMLAHRVGQEARYFPFN